MLATVPRARTRQVTLIRSASCSPGAGNARCRFRGLPGCRQGAPGSRGRCPRERGHLAFCYRAGTLPPGCGHVALLRRPGPVRPSRGIRPRRSASVGARSNRCRRGPAHRGGLPASRRSRARRRPGERDGAAPSAAPGSRRDRARGGQGPAAHPPRHRSGRADAGEVGMGVRSDFGARHARSGKRGRAMVTAARALHGMACRLGGSVCPPGRAWSDSPSLCAH